MTRSFLLSALFLPTALAADPPQPLVRPAGHSGRVHAVAFDPQGTVLATAGADGTVRVWNVASGEPLHAFTDVPAPTCVAFRCDGQFVAAGGGSSDASGEVAIWHARSGKRSKHFTGYSGRVVALAYHPDSAECGLPNSFAIGCADGTLSHRYSHTNADEWTARFPKERMALVHFRPDGTLVGLTGTHGPALYRAANGTAPTKLPNRSYSVHAAAISPDGAWAVTAGVDEIDVCDAKTGDRRHALAGVVGHTYAVAFTPDSRMLVTGGGNCRSHDNKQPSEQLNLWDVATGKRLAQVPGKLPVATALAVSPDGRLLAVGGVKGEVVVWRLADLK